jgi:hypothetical protein
VPGEVSDSAGTRFLFFFFLFFNPEFSFLLIPDCGVAGEIQDFSVPQSLGDCKVMFTGSLPVSKEGNFTSIGSQTCGGN